CDNMHDSTCSLTSGGCYPESQGGTASCTRPGNLPYDPIAQGDYWLQSYLPTVLASQWYKQGGTVIITWDEGKDSTGWNGTSGGHVPTIVVSAASNGPLTAGGNHYGTLRSIEEAYGVGLLGQSADVANGDLLAGLHPWSASYSVAT